MSFLKRTRKKGVTYYSVAQSYRDKTGKGQQRILQNLGTYERALAALEKSHQHRHLITKLAAAEGRFQLPNSPILPAKKYQVIYADPPWEHRRNSSSYKKRRNMPNYDRMSFEQLAALPIRELAEFDAYLFLWTTNTHMAEAIQLLEAWGEWEIKTIITWVKTCKTEPTKPKMGMGDWIRNCTEHLILATRGKPKSFGCRGLGTGMNRLSAVLEPATNKNSEKPDSFRKLIEQLCPDMTRVELFSRHQATAGWDVWGNQVGLLDSA